MSKLFTILVTVLLTVTITIIVFILFFSYMPQDRTEQKGNMSSSSVIVNSSEINNTHLASEQVNTAEYTTAYKSFSDTEKTIINDEMQRWADERAKMSGMAVSGEFFGHGAGGDGDYTVETGDGTACLQHATSLDNRAPDGTYSSEIIGGLTWYYSLNGTKGYTAEAGEPVPTITGFSEVADINKPMIRYLFGNNGVVYEADCTASVSIAATDYYEVSSDTSAQAMLMQIFNNQLKSRPWIN